MTDDYREGADAIARAQAGDDAARERVAERALRVALRTALAVIGERETAADVAQDVALTAMRRLGSIRDPRAFDAWVHRVALRESVRAVRRRRLTQRREIAIHSGLEDHAAGPQAAEDVELRLVMAERLRALPDRQRAAVVLRYVHDLPDERIADALGCRVGTVHALLSRARSALHDDPVVREFNPAHIGDFQ